MGFFPLTISWILLVHAKSLEKDNITELPDWWFPAQTGPLSMTVAGKRRWGRRFFGGF